jgi:hypothetical protein
LDRWLIALTVLGGIVYGLVLLGSVPKLWGGPELLDALLLLPVAFPALAMASAVRWYLRKGTTRRGRLFWVSSLIIGCMGWPVSCFHLAVRSGPPNFIAH